jgi:hypothetical protein
MKKHLTVVLVILCLSVFACQKGETPSEDSAGIRFQKLSLDEAIAQAKEQNKLIMVDFFSPT